ncbi:glycosyltransferase family 2 protein [Lacibacter sp.]|uniref:glycosyltransferase family 2 protein n=1 Tax=Lacibacter sp. TaxID=1915409 RepID=UPI002B4ABF82|nr:glycosyltransferase family 2 protein [Lacibacter sp.]HLP36091.1 glycosyltransferase family 2 protein [Lacibacter sp.]
MNSPLVSVLMTSFNREKYIGQAIESVLASSYMHFELIIVDDRSTDDTVAIAQSYAVNDSRVHVYINEQNIGDYPNRNKAASYAKGEFLKYLDADDLIYRHGIEVMVEYMERFPNAGFGLSVTGFDDDEPYPMLLLPEDIIRSEFLSKSYLTVGPSASIIRKDAFEAVGGFSGVQFIGDTELWLRLAENYPMVLMNPSFNWWRQHPEQQMKQEKKNREIAIKRLNLSLRHLERNRSVFTAEEYQFALKRKKQHFARSILSQTIKKGDLKSLQFYLKKSGLELNDWLAGLRGYM